VWGYFVRSVLGSWFYGAVFSLIQHFKMSSEVQVVALNGTLQTSNPTVASLAHLLA
jgi:hypothetical protein